MTTDNAGNIYAACETPSTPYNPNLTSSIAKWNGNDWSLFGSPFGSQILAVTSDFYGNIYIGGLFNNGRKNYVALYGKKASWVGGGADNLWSNPANWSNGLVPDSLTDVTIDNMVECIINTPSVCRTLIVAPGSKLTLNNSLNVLQ